MGALRSAIASSAQWMAATQYKTEESCKRHTNEMLDDLSKKLTKQINTLTATLKKQDIALIRTMEELLRLRLRVNEQNAAIIEQNAVIMERVEPAKLVLSRPSWSPEQQSRIERGLVVVDKPVVSMPKPELFYVVYTGSQVGEGFEELISKLTADVRTKVKKHNYKQFGQLVDSSSDSDSEVDV